MIDILGSILADIAPYIITTAIGLTGAIITAGNLENRRCKVPATRFDIHCLVNGQWQLVETGDTESLGQARLASLQKTHPDQEFRLSVYSLY